MELRKEHVQNFLKRLRYYKGVRSKREDGNDLKYFAVGEYGGRFRRPHYHMLLFNAKLELIIGEQHAKMVKRGILKLDGATPFKCEAWKAGNITVGIMTNASVGYTCKYMLKDWKPMHRNDDREPQFRLMSKGLGANYLTPKMIAWHKADLVNRLYVNIDAGKKCSMPRYYKEKLFKQIFDDAIDAHRAKKDVGITVRFKMLKELAEKAKQDKSYGWNKLQADIASFERLKYEVQKRDQKNI